MSDVGIEDSGQVPVPPQQPSAGPGMQLATRRQALGWTIEQVANQLNLAPRQVQAMEDDNYAALPGIVIARGFVRSYAKLLKLDPAPLLALIAEKDAPSPESLELRRTLSATFTESSLPVVKQSGSRGKWLALALLLAIGAGGWFAWHEGLLNGLQLPDGLSTTARQAPSSSQATPDGGSGVPMGQAGDGVPAAPAAEPAASQPSAQAPAQPQVAPPAAGPSPVVPPAGHAAQNSGAAPAQATVVAGAEAASSKTAEKLVLKMREASWIELKREDGSAIVSRLMPAGSTESFDVERGARLVVGNASGVDVTYRGQALNLTADAKSNVARLNLK